MTGGTKISGCWLRQAWSQVEPARWVPMAMKLGRGGLVVAVVMVYGQWGRRPGRKRGILRGNCRPLPKQFIGFLWAGAQAG